MIRRIASSEFRVVYARVDEPVAVTVLDRVIGWYIPGGVLEQIYVGDEALIVLRPAPRSGQQAPVDGSAGDAGRSGAPEEGSSAPHSPSLAEPVAAASPKGPGAPADGSTTGMSQRDRDKVLAKVRGSK